MATSPKSQRPRPAAKTPAVTAKRRPTAEQVAAQVREQIQSGVLEPGEWLRETRLCADFGAGRSTVREALKTLAEDGLVKFERFRGAYVASLSLVEMFDLFETRAALYGLAARFACFRASNKQMAAMIAKIAELVDDAERATPAAERIRLGSEIFVMLSQTAGEDAQAMIATVRRKSRWHYSSAGLAESPGALGPVDHWRALAAALGARDADAAAESARRIILFMQQEVMRVMISRGLGAATGPVPAKA
jgi:DNA-binding GntR family transcriptional regulator